MIGSFKYYVGDVLLIENLVTGITSEVEVLEVVRGGDNYVVKVLEDDRTGLCDLEDEFDATGKRTAIITKIRGGANLEN